MADTVAAVKFLHDHRHSWKEQPLLIKLRGRGGRRDRARKTQSIGNVLSPLRHRHRRTDPKLLPWPEVGCDPCGTRRWDYIFYEGNKVAQIQAKILNLSGRWPIKLANEKPQKGTSATQILLLGHKKNGKIRKYNID
ncbi:hypothetical protein PIB30_002726 [Stylosanthes scabra]|uniref:Uncharacterized protein n=1 Tax=Stylosanthes scabra TaxID=79078 RepID=A0ABU6R2Z8_9FABA|nr:hypothetical protein [Stylosanthes scabra]